MIRYPPYELDIKAPRNLKPRSVMVYPRDPKPDKRKDYHRQYLAGIGDKMYRPSYLLPSMSNDKIALEARVLKATPVPNPAIVAPFLMWTRRNFWKLFPKTRYRKGFKPPEFEEYLKNSNSSPHVKQILRETHAKMSKEGITYDSVLDKRTLRKYNKKAAFLKVENTNHRSMGEVTEKAGRLIQGCQPEYIVLCGPWFQKLQQYIKRDWNKNNFICFTSGVSTHHAAQALNKIPISVKVETDISAFDSSQDIFMAEEEVLWCKKFGAPRAVIDLMRNDITKFGTTFFGWFYSVFGIRCSGKPDTSLFNSIWNGLINCFIICATNGLTIDEARALIIILVQGDDGAMGISCSLQVPDFNF
jgi:hypothetical protein